MHGGSSHTCGLRVDGSVVCWGGNDHRQASSPPNIRLASLSTSYNHNCGLQENGIAICWGAAGLGGQSYTITSPHPVLTVAGPSTGDLRNNGQQLRFAVPRTLTGSTTFTLRVRPVYNNRALTEQSFALSATLDTNSGQDTWTVDSGTEGSHEFAVEYLETSADGRVIQITQQSVPPSLGRLYWEFSASYPAAETRTDNLTETILSAPRAVFTTISAGFDHTCALLPDGSPECWGDNSEGQSFPPHGVTFKAISAGFRFSCGLTTDGAPVCWGDINRWQMPVPSDENLVSLTTGGAHACGLREDGTPVCWGRNNFRQSAPPEGEVFSMITAGERHTCAIRLDGTPMCWGNNPRGQTAAPRDEVLTNIYAGGSHTCGIRPDSTPVCWGDNTYDQNWPPRSAPKPTPTPSPTDLFRHKDPNCADGDGCTFSNIQLDDGIWQVSVRLRENCSDLNDCTNTAQDFKVTIGEDSDARVLMDFTASGRDPVSNLRDHTTTLRIGPEETDHAERGRQYLTIHATGIWTLTISFVRGLPEPSF